MHTKCSRIFVLWKGTRVRVPEERRKVVHLRRSLSHRDLRCLRDLNRNRLTRCWKRERRIISRVPLRLHTTTPSGICQTWNFLAQLLITNMNSQPVRNFSPSVLLRDGTRWIKENCATPACCQRMSVWLKSVSLKQGFLRLWNVKVVLHGLAPRNWLHSQYCFVETKNMHS